MNLRAQIKCLPLGHIAKQEVWGVLMWKNNKADSTGRRLERLSFHHLIIVYSHIHQQSISIILEQPLEILSIRKSLSQRASP